MAVLLAISSFSAGATKVLTHCTEAELRATIQGGAAVTVRFNCDGVVRLTTTLEITNRVRIEGGGHTVVLTGSNTVRLFSIAPGASLELSGLVLADGVASGTNGLDEINSVAGSGDGGAILNQAGILSVDDCVFRNCVAMGGAPGNAFGTKGGAGRGGAVCNLGGTVGMTNCEFALNRAECGVGLFGFGSTGGEAQGGAVANEGGTLFLLNCVFSNNRARTYALRVFGYASTAPAYGGAVYTSGDAELNGCRLTRNQSQADEFFRAGGGGVFQRQGALRIARCWVERNSALAGDAGLIGMTPEAATGGGICIDGGILALTSSTVSDNSAIGGASFGNPVIVLPSGAGQGGGLFNAARAEVTNCTFVGNLAQGGVPFYQSPSGNGEGGGIFSSAGGVTFLTHCSLAGDVVRLGRLGNIVPPPGGLAVGGEFASLGGSVYLRNTFLANSLSGSNWFGPGLIDEGNNLSSDSSAHWTAAGSRGGVDVKVSPLMTFGEGWPTLALLEGSPAIDAGSSAHRVNFDQRGRARPFGLAPDIGAFESSVPFTAHGRIAGYLTPASPIFVTSTAGATGTDSAGVFTLTGFSNGQHLITPTSPDIVFAPRQRLVSFNADVVSLNFYAYQTNALAIERVARNEVRGVFAGAAGVTYQALSSTNLLNWTPWSTNTTDTEGLWQFLSPGPASSQARFFRIVPP